MSRDFIKRKVNFNHIQKAADQQRQINYFVKSSIQNDISKDSLTAWAQRKYATDDHFLNFIKTIFKTPNFITFYKYLRFPSESSRLINERVKSQLSRVFFSEDKSMRYSIDGNEVECPEEVEHTGFDKKVLNWLMHRFNDVIIADVDASGNPFQFLVSIDKITSIEMVNSEISKIAYPARQGEVKGFLYIDDKAYIFYPENDSQETITTHDLGRCPATFVSQQAFDEADNEIVRLSLFTYVRASLEEYDFLKTLQKITMPNGAFPTTIKLKRNNTSANPDVKKAAGQPEPMSLLSSQQSSDRSGVSGDQEADSQALTVIEIPMVKKPDGGIDTDVVKGFMHHIYVPVEVLEFINKRIDSIGKEIIIDLIGSFSETSESSKNELQVGLGYVSKQDKLRTLSTEISELRTKTDNTLLSIAYGADRIHNHAFYGADFFLETEADVYNLIKISPNPIESRNLLDRLARTKHRYNESQLNRDRILYRLIPYATIADFEAANLAVAVGENTFQLQTRFNYWIDMFEANYGDITYFWNTSLASDAEKLILINRLLNDLINSNYEKPSNIAPDGAAATV